MKLAETCFIFPRNNHRNIFYRCTKIRQSYRAVNLPNYIWSSTRLHRCWWRMLESKCVGVKFKVLVTVLTILVRNNHYLFTWASGTNIRKMSPTSKFSHQHRQIVTNFKSLKLRCHHRWLDNITVNVQLTWFFFTWSTFPKNKCQERPGIIVSINL